MFNTSVRYNQALNFVVLIMQPSLTLSFCRNNQFASLIALSEGESCHDDVIKAVIMLLFTCSCHADVAAPFEPSRS